MWVIYSCRIARAFVSYVLSSRSLVKSVIALTAVCSSLLLRSISSPPSSYGVLSISLRQFFSTLMFVRAAMALRPSVFMRLTNSSSFDCVSGKIQSLSPSQCRRCYPLLTLCVLQSVEFFVVLFAVIRRLSFSLTGPGSVRVGVENSDYAP